jgi:hypothetical protein
MAAVGGSASQNPKTGTALEDLLERPFFRARAEPSGRIRPWTLEDLEEFARHTGDPFAGRLAAGHSPRVSLQIEATDDPPVWIGLDSGELSSWAGGIARLWARFGLERGETIAFFDYGSCPLVLLASSSFVPYVGRGAAERLGLTAVCNDGVAAMAERMVSIVEHLRPSALCLRRDVLGPFSEALRRRGVSLRSVRWAAIAESEGWPARAEAERFSAEWGVSVRRILRADAACCLAGDCDACGLFHLDRRLYWVEPGDDRERVLLANRFVRTCPTVAYDLGPGEIRRGGCPREPGALRVALE